MLDMHLDTLVRRIKGLTDEQKTMVSLIVAEASDKKMAGYLGVSAADCPAKVAALLTELKVSDIRYVKAAGLEMLGFHDAAREILSSVVRVATQQPAKAANDGRKPPHPPPSPIQPTRDAFSDEVVKAAPTLRAFAISLCGNGDRANDLVQETLVRALANRDSFTMDTNMMAWLFTILRNHFRSEKRRRRREIEDWDGHYAQTLKVQPGQLGAIELREVHEAFAQVPPEQLKVLRLVGVSGFGYEEAATKLGISSGTVKSRLHRARQGLKRILAVDDVIGPDPPTLAVLNGGRKD